MKVAMRALRDRLQFRHLRTRLAALYAGLFAIALIIVAVAAQVMIQRHARESVRAELTASGSVYDQIWALKVRALTDSADVLAHDFGFRSAVASGDQPTIASALANLSQRVNVPDAFVVDQNGDVIGNGPQDLRRSIAELPYELPRGQNAAVVSVGSGTYRLVISPVLAPTEIGWVIFAVPLDRAEMLALQRLSAIPITATILSRESGKGEWRSTTSTMEASNELDRFIDAREDRSDQTAEMARLPTGNAFALARGLEGPDGKPSAVLLLSYPLSKAYAPYRALQIGLALAGLLGLVMVVWGSRRLARAISQPITALEAAARSLEEGARTEVAVVGSDEIGRLAVSFNRMSAGIVEREHRISHLAFHDTLTDLPNRTFFREQLDSSLSRVSARDMQIVVLCLDLDGFKGVNDTLGHPVGDALLKIVSEVLCELAPDATVSRLGGDEFAIILSTERGSDRPRALAQTIVDRMQEPLQADGHQIATGASIGIAIGPDDGADADTLLKNADLALYRAKQDGRGNFRFFESSMDAAARARRQLELDLRNALRAGQFRLNFQPIFDLAQDRITGFEALLRWNHPERGAIDPIDFIPVAEDTGLIVAIGEWVLHEACQQACQWPADVRVAVNVSPLQFRNSGFANIVFQALSRSGLAANRLEIEITESNFLEGVDTTVALLHRLRALGVRIALDDFGTGYSSLSYLRSFPFDKIKIDRSFITNLALDEGAKAIVAAIVHLARALSMDTTAEGVEDDNQLACLRSQGCGSIQGYLFSRPIEAEMVVRMLNERVVQAA